MKPSSQSSGGRSNKSDPKQSEGEQKNRNSPGATQRSCPKGDKKFGNSGLAINDSRLKSATRAGTAHSSNPVAPAQQSQIENNSSSVKSSLSHVKQTWRLPKKLLTPSGVCLRWLYQVLLVRKRREEFLLLVCKSPNSTSILLPLPELLFW